MGQIKTFEEFVKRVLIITFWVLVLVPMILIPIILLGLPHDERGVPLPIDTPFGRINSALAPISDPLSMLPLLNNFMNSPMFKITVYPGFTFAALLATGVILLERKMLAKIHYRIGPLYAGRLEGILQPIADLFKLLFKEIIVPTKADKLLFLASPLMIFAVAAALLSVIPLAPDTVIVHSEIGLLIFFAIMGFFPLVVLVASWASANKFSLIGGLRSLHQLIAFEVPLLLSTLGAVILASSLDLVKIVNAQATMWFIVPQIIGAIIFMIGALAELERIPFDLPEADTEIVAGWLTEYSGMNFGLFQLAIYIKFYALSALFTLIFLGGWLGPDFAPPAFWFVLKTLLVIIFMILLRGANPRVRIDMVVRLGWAWLVALAFVNIFIALLVASLGVL